MKKLWLILTIAVGLTCAFQPAADALTFFVSGGDRPYYVHGPGYWRGGAYYVWAPGYWTYHHHHRHWVHGYYRVR